MEAKFNFYDLYGYLLPGIICVAVVAVPLALAGVPLPSVHLGEALILLALAYVIGNLLSAWSRPLFVMEWVDDGRGPASPSETLLRPGAPGLTADDRKSLLEAAGLEARGADEELSREEAKRVFAIARRKAVEGDSARYFEQYQGMYAFMQGIGISALLGVAASFAVALTPIIPSSITPLLPYVGAALLLLLLYGEVRENRRRRMPFVSYGPPTAEEWILGLAPRLLLIGVMTAWIVAICDVTPSAHSTLGPALWGALCSAVSVRCYID